MPFSPGTWVLPAHTAFDEGLRRVQELVDKGSGTWTVVDASPRGEGEAHFRDAFASARLEEWAEFEADCQKFEAEIAKEISQRKFTLAELEEEEQSLDRLRRWFRELKARDVLRLPQASEASDHLARCGAQLEAFAELVYEATLM